LARVEGRRRRVFSAYQALMLRAAAWGGSAVVRDKPKTNPF